MKRLFFSLIFFALSWASLQAQVPADALRFSSLDVLGTARTIGVGGGIGALGADFSVMSTNPAGLAAFRRSEFTVTPYFSLNNTEATLDNSGNSTAVQKNKVAFSLNNLGLVFSRQGRNPNWKTSNIAIGLNRIASFNQTFTYRGESTGSYIDFFQEASIDLAPSELSNFTTGLAFDTEAIYDLDDDLFYETDVELNENALLYKEQTIRRRGGINELSLAFSGNFKERLMIGVSLGFPILSYTEEKVYNEEDRADEVPAYVDMQFNENLTTTGSGVNLKLGLIFRLSQMIRLGAAIHTPTNYGTLVDNFETSMQHNYIDGDGNNQFFESASPTDQGEFEYQLKTPWRFIGSAGFIIKRSGFITGEVEYLKYSGAKFDLTNTDNSQGTIDFQDNLNSEIASIYQSAINLRVGGEFALKIFRFRAGVTLSGTPYADNYISDNPNIKGIGDTSTAYALGFGVRQQRYFLDFAFRFSDQESTFTPYTVSDIYPQNSVTTNAVRSNLIFTFGYKF
ncbi:MAG: hypothetical protein AB8G86_19895 [Saprospiraceae bacterium]